MCPLASKVSKYSYFFYAIQLSACSNVQKLVIVQQTELILVREDKNYCSTLHVNYTRFFLALHKKERKWIMWEMFGAKKIAHCFAFCTKNNLVSTFLSSPEKGGSGFWTAHVFFTPYNHCITQVKLDSTQYIGIHSRSFRYNNPHSSLITSPPKHPIQHLHNLILTN